MTSPNILDEDFSFTFGDDAPDAPSAVPGFTPATNAGAPIPPIGTSAAGAQTQPTSSSTKTILIVLVIIGIVWWTMKRRKR